MIVILGDYCDTSYWIRSELTLGAKLGLPILGVWPKSKRAKSDIVTLAHSTVEWEEEAIFNQLSVMYKSSSPAE